MASVDNDLRCNRIKCGTNLRYLDQAVVTTCSHIFCVPCANVSFSQSRQCPACEQHLNEEDDLVAVTLNPSANYRTTILSGYSPMTILDIARRALDFWCYQTTQETAYQSLMLKQNRSKLGSLEQNYQQIQIELGRAQQEGQELVNQLDNERRRSQGMEQALREKEKELVKIKNMSDNMMKRTILNNVQNSEDVRAESVVSSDRVLLFLTKHPASFTPHPWPPAAKLAIPSFITSSPQVPPLTIAKTPVSSYINPAPDPIPERRRGSNNKNELIKRVKGIKDRSRVIKPEAAFRSSARLSEVNFKMRVAFMCGEVLVKVCKGARRAVGWAI